jgi:hypothetical protein
VTTVEFMRGFVVGLIAAGLVILGMAWMGF